MAGISVLSWLLLLPVSHISPFATLSSSTLGGESEEDFVWHIVSNDWQRSDFTSTFRAIESAHPLNWEHSDFTFSRSLHLQIYTFRVIESDHAVTLLHLSGQNICTPECGCSGPLLAKVVSSSARILGLQCMAQTDKQPFSEPKICLSLGKPNLLSSISSDIVL